jgi:hypothetical protein
VEGLGFGTLDQQRDFWRCLTEVGVLEVFVDLGQTTTTSAELLDLAGAFIEGVRAG